jgi:hypothetical protein
MNDADARERPLARLRRLLVAAPDLLNRRRPPAPEGRSLREEIRPAVAYAEEIEPLVGELQMVLGEREAGPLLVAFDRLDSAVRGLPDAMERDLRALSLGRRVSLLELRRLVARRGEKPRRPRLRKGAVGRSRVLPVPERGGIGVENEVEFEDLDEVAFETERLLAEARDACDALRRAVTAPSRLEPAAAPEPVGDPDERPAGPTPRYKPPTVPDPDTHHGGVLTLLREALCGFGQNGEGFVHLPNKTSQLDRLRKMGYMIESARSARQEGKDGVPNKGHRWFASALRRAS